MSSQSSRGKRDAQYAHIGEQASEFLAAGDPVVSLEAMSRDVSGQGRGGTGPDIDALAARLRGAPPDATLSIMGKAGFSHVRLGGEACWFGTESLRQWWRGWGRERYPGAGRMMVATDPGPWGEGLQGFSDETGLALAVSFFPPGIMKWSSLGQRVFSFFSENGRAGKPRFFLSVTVDLVSPAGSAEGTVECLVTPRWRWPVGGEPGKAVGPAPSRAWNYSITPKAGK
ncbi:MAG: hypothetical protein LBP92_00435 [Deltaproteobacteria bacterium]|jgi:hypothetical protein|nr:hypothetical protein [Deltaproteobacteria bacterium]